MEYSEKLKSLKTEILKQHLTCLPGERFDNIFECAEFVLSNSIQGDFVETGVWRGGACIFMRSLLKEFGDNDRNVYVCDSFEGLPKDEMPRDLFHHAVTDIARKHHDNLAISLEEVQSHFENFGVLDENVKFVKGWFKDTLPYLQAEKIALLRLDGDMYSSTMDALNNLYHKVSKGGFIIVDDYGHYPQCKEAIDEFRASKGITAPFTYVDYSCIYWTV